MARHQLTAATIKKATDGKLQDGGGLILVKKGDRGKWVFRYSHQKRRREMGLGPWPDLSLAGARASRDKWAEVLATGVDPMVERSAEIERAAEAEREKRDPTLAELFDIVFEAKKDGLRGGGVRGRWRSPIDKHVIPRLGGRNMSGITQHDIYDALKPIWRSKHPTAEKAIQRLRIIFDEGRYMGLGVDPFTVDAARRMLGEVRHVTKHITATKWQDIPGLWQRLDPELASGLCLRWMILTMVRFDGCRAASVSEVDQDIWTVPQDRVKGRVGRVEDFRVPLPKQALQIVDQQRRLSKELMFVGHRGSSVTSRAVEVYLDRIGEKGRPHGFRTAFRTWVQDTDACSFEVAETILGHKIGTSVERSYARSDLLERRAVVMQSWADYVTGTASAKIATLEA